MSVITSRVTVPPARSNAIARPRLQNRLHEAPDARLTVVQAPAGYGKTTLLTQWYNAVRQQGMDAAWLTLDSSNDGFETFLTHIDAMIQGLGHTSQNDRRALHLADWAAAICARLEKRPLTFLFFDDIHRLRLEASDALAKLVEWAPDSVRFVVTSRKFPAFSLARLRARGRLQEIDIKEIAFTPAEIEKFLKVARPAPLIGAPLKALVDLTEGWAAGLRLACDVSRGGTVSEEMLAGFSGAKRTVADFFAEEVFSHITPEQQQFLIHTCILERLCGPLCDAVTGQRNSAEILVALEAAGLFLLSDDDEGKWYRYHPLFSGFLNARMLSRDRGLELILHQRASDWYEGAGAFDDALRHGSLATDDARQAALLERWCDKMVHIGKIRLLDKYATRLPPPVLAQSPRLLLVLAWWRTSQLAFDEARHLLERARTCIARLTPMLEASAAHELSIMLLHREMVLAAAHDQSAAVEEKCKVLLAEFGDTNLNIQCSLYGRLISSYRHQLKYGEMHKLEATAQLIADRCGSQTSNVPLFAEIGLSLFERGNTQAALRAFEQGVTQAKLFAEVNASLAALAGLPLAELAYEWNDCARAQCLVDEYLPYFREIGFIDHLISGYLISARLRQLDGDTDAALKILDDGLNHALERGLERLRTTVLGERIRILLRVGQIERANETGQQAKIPFGVATVIPGPSVTADDEVRAEAWARLAIANNRTSDALVVANKWICFSLQRGAVAVLVRWTLIKAQSLVISGSVKSAQRALREALLRAAPGRYMRTFLDEGPLIGDLLAEGYGDGSSDGDQIDKFAGEILAAFDVSKGVKREIHDSEDRAINGSLGWLSWRETKILTLVASGMQNREIGKRLGLTEGTVKWYMQQIYNKIGVRRRSQAVDRARRMGLVH